MTERYVLRFTRTIHEHAEVVVNADNFDEAAAQAEKMLEANNSLEWKEGFDSETEYDIDHVPYPSCRHPLKCAGKGYCQSDPACND